MAAGKKKTTRKKRIRKKAGIRRKGDDLPKMIDSARVLRALDGTMTEKQFIKAYDHAEGKRGGGLRTPSAKLIAAYSKFEGDGSFGAFCKTMECDSQRGTTLLGRMLKWNAKD